ncbi:GNAT family N-acetyltransferase [Alkalihalobacillus trypoxylicola]|uniref:N-acetyltransferase domain-containing protein n=1 Tax=Alkalihalobacillus trypoxylicola TaxID=519424 RepID=A0A161PLN0_9BACI|nr:GNAT family N-acetyltransferase [Alkalihalobacillus trypoxylicola]KYG35296.1 hypothetical protein AZF04_02875 [Alkalihalobacillus trypoxylicola]GAF63843.1 putative acetyltransferase [Bacillus sp. TS-2]
MNIRFVQSDDYPKIIAVLNEWWGGRNMKDKLPRLFFEHFQNTSYIMEKDGELIGFIIGFLSQSQSEKAYIHFVGVHPNYRQLKIGKRLYEHFIHNVKESGVKTLHCITSPINKGSIAYHQKLGFSIVKGDAIEDGISIHSHYDGVNESRVVFAKHI